MAGLSRLLVVIKRLYLNATLIMEDTLHEYVCVRCGDDRDMLGYFTNNGVCGRCVRAERED